MHRKWPWQRSAGRRCGGGYEPELAICCRRSVSRGDTVLDRDREFRTGCCRERLHGPASCWREGSGEKQKRLGIRGNSGPSSFGSCGVDESTVDHLPARPHSPFTEATTTRRSLAGDDPRGAYMGAVMQCLACRADNKMLLIDALRDDTMKEPVIEHQIYMCSACRHMIRRVAFSCAKMPAAVASRPRLAEPGGLLRSLWHRQRLQTGSLRLRAPRTRISTPLCRKTGRRDCSKSGKS